ncbi:hypothetical protein GCM10010274_59960 [Streptomyces lavendofoliae]|uniref:Uncharacterized protein n=1 Tax=Streptomyces lavendofoliae TaxID=67314 RepID=A0A918I3H1_9ACTN|nr:hypothetical protein GCM10010274_59960 [Streptomyces lavendofoliae]
MSEEQHGPAAFAAPRPDEPVRDEGHSPRAQFGSVSYGLPAVYQQHGQSLGAAFPHSDRGTGHCRATLIVAERATDLHLQARRRERLTPAA